MNCLECGKKASRNGKTKSGIQKYICKNENCKLSFTENYGNEKVKYTKTEERVVNMLLNFLGAKPNKKLSLKEYFYDAKNSRINIKHPNFKVFKQKINEPLNFSGNGIHLLISVHNNEITLTKFCDPYFDKDHTLTINDGKIMVKNFKKRPSRIK